MDPYTYIIMHARVYTPIDDVVTPNIPVTVTHRCLGVRQWSHLQSVSEHTKASLSPRGMLQKWEVMMDRR